MEYLDPRGGSNRYNIKTIIQSEHPIHSRPPRWILYKNGKIYKSSECFYLRIGDKRMFSDLKKIGLVPNKSKIIKFPNILNKYLNHFIRGYFDGDGSIFIEYGDGVRQKIIFKKLKTSFSSGSLLFLRVLSDNLFKIVGVRHAKIYNGNRDFQLVYSTRDSVKLFKFMYRNSCGLFLKRKFNIFEKFFKTRVIWLDKEASGILKQNK